MFSFVVVKGNPTDQESQWKQKRTKTDKILGGVKGLLEAVFNLSGDINFAGNRTF